MLNMPNPHVLAGLLLQTVKGNWSEWSTIADYFRGSIRSHCLSSPPGGYAELSCIQLLNTLGLLQPSTAAWRATSRST